MYKLTAGRGRWVAAALGLLLAMLWVAMPATVSAQEDVVEVILQNLSFNPKELRIKAGTTVRFVNKDALDHDVVQARPDQVRSRQFGFQSSTLKSGESWEYTFEKPGEYPILCMAGSHYLLGMTMKIIVE